MGRMTTNEIAREEWETFLDGFSRQHEGWTVTVEVFETDGDVRVEATDVPFAGVAFGGDNAGRETISVMVGVTPEQAG